MCIKRIYRIDIYSFSDTEVFKLIMSASEYDIIIPVSTFVKSAFKHRGSIVLYF